MRTASSTEHDQTPDTSQNEKGSSAVEYAMVVAGMATMLVSALAVFGDSIVAAFGTLGTL